MSWLIDTHVFIWFESGSDRLPKEVRDLISTTDEPVFVSAASIWEISIKRGLGKLDFAGSPRAAARASGFLELPIGGMKPKPSAICGGTICPPPLSSSLVP